MSAPPSPPPDRAGKTILLVVALLVGFAVLPRLFSPRQDPLVGKPAPDFILKVVANGEPGQTEVRVSDLKGRAVLLDFWATWCGPCQAEAPVIDRLATRYRARGLTVVGVNTSDAAGLAAAWTKRHNIGFPIVYDADNVAAEAYGVDKLPSLVVISREGKVTAVRHGMTSDAELDKLVMNEL